MNNQAGDKPVNPEQSAQPGPARLGPNRSGEESRQFQQCFGMVFQNNPAPMAIVTAPGGALLELSESWMRLCGCGKDGVLGRTIGETGLVPDASELQRLASALEQPGGFRGLPLGFDSLDGERREILLSGEPAELEGEACFILTAQDITELRRTERALRISEGRFRELFEHSPIAVWEEDLSGVAERFQELRAEGVADLRNHLAAHPEELGRLLSGVRVLQVNDACLALMACASLEELEGNLGRFATEESRAFLEDEMVALFEGAIVFEGREAHLDARGRARESYLRIKVMPGHGADLSRVLVSVTDQTERMAAEAERRRLEIEVNHLQRLESLGRLAGGVAHDMNNVLCAIMAVGSLLQAVQGQDPAIARDATTILKAASRGRDLVKGLLDFSRKELGVATELDLNELARSEAELLKRTTLKRIQIELDLDPDLHPIIGEPGSIQSALMNLCVNAVDAMPERGTIRLISRNHGRAFVELAVQDSGEGMGPEVLARAREPFFTTKPAGKGTGLGLSQVHGTVTAHGGTLDIQSQPGLGTRVTMMLPSSPHQVQAGLPVQEFLRPRLQPLRILLVDDEELIRVNLVRLLEHLGHQPQSASSGPEALRLLEHGMPADLAILDLNMPGMDGLETFSRLRGLRPDLPALLVTGFADERVGAALKAFDNLRVLKKPFDLNELALTLADW
jgi:PAS domain S-box-containing protein